MKNKHAVALGKLGGKRNTPAQNQARARNGKLGGRPRKQVVPLTPPTSRGMIDGKQVCAPHPSSEPYCGYSPQYRAKPDARIRVDVS